MCCAESLQSCQTLCNSMYCNLWGSSVLEILQAKILEWVATPSRGSSQPRDLTHISWIFCIAGRFFSTELLEKPHVLCVCVCVCVCVFVSVDLHMCLICCRKIIALLVGILTLETYVIILRSLTNWEHHAMRKLKSHRKITCMYLGWQKTAVINHQTWEWGSF